MKKIKKWFRKKRANKFIKKMSIKVSERMIVIGIIYAIFRLFNVSVKVGF